MPKRLCGPHYSLTCRLSRPYGSLVDLDSVTVCPQPVTRGTASRWRLTRATAPSAG